MLTESETLRTQSGWTVYLKHADDKTDVSKSIRKWKYKWKEKNEEKNEHIEKKKTHTTYELLNFRSRMKEMHG